MASKTSLPTCLRCSSKKYPNSKKRYYPIDIEITCGSFRVPIPLVFDLCSLFLCQTCYSLAYTNQLPTLPQPHPEPKFTEVPIFHFETDTSSSQSKKRKASLPPISKAVKFWHEKLEDQPFQKKLRSILNNRDYYDDFCDVLPHSKLFPRVMKQLYKKHEDLFDEITLLLSLMGGIGQKKMRDTIRGSIFEKMVPFFHFNPISPLNRMAKLRSNTIRGLLEDKLGYRIEKTQGQVCIVGNAKAVLEFLLNHPGSEGVYQSPHDKVGVLAYIDSYPFFKFSENCNQQTSVQIQILSPHSLYDVFPLCRWFGSDDHSSTSIHGPLALSQFAGLSIEQEGKKKDVLPRLISDGKNRRGLNFLHLSFLNLL